MRRLQRAEEATPEAIKGEEELRIGPPKKPEKELRKEPEIQLDKFLT
ncbi:MAG: hypothetical protein NC925_03375 [Candidatus Omnitrophica bacterium]|nr:hypothetical protein [Candidatus Omnitrophota bacterium]